jgi:hypothetical protein
MKWNEHTHICTIPKIEMKFGKQFFAFYSRICLGLMEEIRAFTHEIEVKRSEWW